MSPKRLNNGMKPSLFPVQISKILLNPVVFGGLNPLPRLFLYPRYGPDPVWNSTYLLTLEVKVDEHRPQVLTLSRSKPQGAKPVKAFEFEIAFGKTFFFYIKLILSKSYKGGVSPTSFTVWSNLVNCFKEN